VVDEFQNMTFAELDTIITRVGQNSKIIFCGDVSQSDLNYKKTDTSGFTQFMNILERVGGDHFFLLKFGHEDIIRSGLVREYIIAKERI
jgi:predicted ribonuclease YlaK